MKEELARLKREVGDLHQLVSDRRKLLSDMWDIHNSHKQNINKAHACLDDALGQLLAKQAEKQLVEDEVKKNNVIAAEQDMELKNTVFTKVAHQLLTKDQFDIVMVETLRRKKLIEEAMK